MAERCRFGAVIVRSGLREPVSGVAERFDAPGRRAIQLCGTVDLRDARERAPAAGRRREAPGGQAAVGGGGARASK